MGPLSSRSVRRLLLGSAVTLSLAIVVVLLASTGQSAKKNQIATTARPLANGVVQAAVGELPTATLAPPPVPTSPATSATTAPTTTTTRPTARAATTTTLSPTTTTSRPAKQADTIPPTVPTSPGGTTVTTGPITPVMVTLRSSYSDAVIVTVGGHDHNLAPGQVTAPFEVMPAASGNDIISVGVPTHPGCGVGDAYGYFFSGKTYTLAILEGGGTCLGGFIGPKFQVIPSLDTTG